MQAASTARTLVLNLAGRKMESPRVLNQPATPILIFLLTVSLMLSASVSEIYDYLQYVVQWQPAVCSDSRHNGWCASNFPEDKFTIHGLWPSNSDGVRVQYCVQQDKFDENEVQYSIRADLNKCWPDLLPDMPRRNDPVVCSSLPGSASFWCRQWEKHGRCSLFNQRDYFNLAVELCTTYNKNINDILQMNQILASNTRLVKSSDITDAINKELKIRPALRCSTPNGTYPNGSKQLLEVVLCVTVDGTSRINCPQSITDRPQSIRYCPSDIYFLSSATPSGATPSGATPSGATANQHSLGH